MEQSLPVPVTLLRPAPDARPQPYVVAAAAGLRHERSLEPEATRARPDARRVHRSLVALPGAARPDPGLPGPQEWAAMLTVAILQVVAGRRPLDQLERWLDDPAITSVRRAVAVRRRDRSGSPSPSDVVSVRVQCLAPRVVEVAARVRVGDRESPGGARSAAVALRLEGVGVRWRCTAVELGLEVPVISAA